MELEAVFLVIVVEVEEVVDPQEYLNFKQVFH
jgi:hypothetical protein